MIGERKSRIPDELLIMPAGWRLYRPTVVVKSKAYISAGGLRVIVTESTYDDGRWWRHVSVSLSNRLPTWSELREVKDLFVGRNRKAIQVFPPQNEYVSVHPYVLHLWCCLEDDPLPDFRLPDGSI